MAAPRIGPPPVPLPRSAVERLRALVPFGLAVREKPRHFREMAKVAWQNLGSWGYAWRILAHGVCDGCSLGPRGLRDDVIEGVHLCTTRLRLLRLNTMGPLEPARLEDVSRLEGLANEELHALGRLPCPLVRRRGERGFRRVAWDEALGLLAERFGRVPGERVAWFATSRGVTNEGYYALQKVARLLGSNHVDYCARLCHAPSVYGLADTMGVGAPNCSLSDFVGTDLLVLWGTNCANNQPVTTKYMLEAKRRGTRIAVVNPYREPGLERYWIPSVAGSALFGTRLMDDYYPVAVGGDIAFMNGVMKALRARGGLDEAFLRDHCRGREELDRVCEQSSWAELERASGLPRAEMERFAEVYAAAKTAVFVYSMGLTQHQHGVQNVRAIATLALVRGMVGRPKCGVMPIRGHSGVQGGAEVGVGPQKFATGKLISEESAKEMASLWGAPVPSRPGLMTPAMVEAAHEGKIEILWSLGGNLLETMPERRTVVAALDRVGLRVHQDIVVNSSMLLPGDLVVLLPTQTRYETPGGITTTSTERRIRFSPEIPGPRIEEAKPEWEVPVLVARRVLPEGEKLLPWKGTQDIREEIERICPIYKGIAGLREEGQSVQWGGERLFEGGAFAKLPGGKARLLPQEIPRIEVPPGKFYLATRRGKQFNSMRQGKEDPLLGGAGRDSVFIAARDASRLGIAAGDPVTLRSEVGELRGRAVIAPVKEGSLQAYWPEANVLIPRRYDPISGEPDYNATVEVIR